MRIKTEINNKALNCSLLNSNLIICALSGYYYSTDYGNNWIKIDLANFEGYKYLEINCLMLNNNYMFNLIFLRCWCNIKKIEYNTVFIQYINSD